MTAIYMDLKTGITFNTAAKMHMKAIYWLNRRRNFQHGDKNIYGDYILAYKQTKLSTRQLKLYMTATCIYWLKRRRNFQHGR